MKRKLIILLAVSLFAVAAPVMAEEMEGMEHHGASHQAMDENCAKECDMLLRNCAQEVSTIQQKITKLQAAIKAEGADQTKLAEVKVLKTKLAETLELLKTLEKPGK